MKSFVIKVGFANVKEAEKKLNEELKKIENFVSMKIVNNGQHSSAVVFCDEENASVTPQVKIIEFSVTDTTEAKKTIDKALEGLDIISVDVATPIDGNRLVVLYAAEEEDEDEGDNPSEGDDTETSNESEITD